MIKENTVFILGAGASKAFGYPTGRELTNYIKTKFIGDFERSFGKVTQPGSAQEEKIDEAKIFVDAFIQSGGGTSIDYFLSRARNHGQRRIIQNYGRLAIAFNIIQREIVHSKNQIDIENDNDDNWLDYFYEHYFLSGQLEIDPEEISQVPISIITFNYDRSLEYLLYSRLKQIVNNNDEDIVMKILNKIPIIHIHGIIAHLPWQVMTKEVKNRIQYGALKLHTADILKQNIKIVHEKSNTDIIREAKSKIKRADKIYFLGFGYDTNNLEKIGIPKLLHEGQQIYGTGRTTNRILHETSQSLLNNGLEEEDIILENKGITQLLTDYP
ncbi:MAG: hypothetical protein HQ509_07850 [Candidatus Marinimicrobia bacterium]|nr:hypothetical protein [Candidatus Neomarinimicrobiota bacterium]